MATITHSGIETQFSTSSSFSPLVYTTSSIDGADSASSPTETNSVWSSIEGYTSTALFASQTVDSSRVKTVDVPTQSDLQSQIPAASSSGAFVYTDSIIANSNTTSPPAATNSVQSSTEDHLVSTTLFTSQTSQTIDLSYAQTVDSSKVSIAISPSISAEPPTYGSQTLGELSLGETGTSSYVSQTSLSKGVTSIFMPSSSIARSEFIQSSATFSLTETPLFTSLSQTFAEEIPTQISSETINSLPTHSASISATESDSEYTSVFVPSVLASSVT